MSSSFPHVFHVVAYLHMLLHYLQFLLIKGPLLQFQILAGIMRLQVLLFLIEHDLSLPLFVELAQVFVSIFVFLVYFMIKLPRILLV